VLKPLPRPQWPELTEHPTASVHSRGLLC